MNIFLPTLIMNLVIIEPLTRKQLNFDMITRKQKMGAVLKKKQRLEKNVGNLTHRIMLILCLTFIRGVGLGPFKRIGLSLL